MKTSDLPLLSVIVPVYNVEEYVEECLQSIVDQNYPNMEILAVNDGSTDNSLQVIKNFAAKHQTVKIFDKPNGGLSDARNSGIDNCSGEYITFIDSDDVLIGRNIYSSLLNILMQDNTLDAVQFDVIHKWKSQEEHKRKYPFKSYTGQEEILEGYLKEWIHVSVCDKIFKKSVFDDIRFPKGEISEDIAIIPELSGSIKKILTTSIGYYGYRYREGSITINKPNIKKTISAYKSNYRYYKAALQYKSLTPIAIRKYIPRGWNLISTVRKNSPTMLKNIYTDVMFIRIGFFSWIGLLRNLKGKELSIKSFILCVLGPRAVSLFQKIFTK